MALRKLAMMSIAIAAISVSCRTAQRPSSQARSAGAAPPIGATEPSAARQAAAAGAPPQTGPATAPGDVDGARQAAIDAEAEALLDRDDSDAAQWRAITALLGRPGDLKDGVFTVQIPRDDLDVSIEGMAVPAGAGIASEFKFYRCECGKTNVIGQFVVADYEANSVIKALTTSETHVVSMGPLLLFEKPRLTLIRFQGEGRTLSMTKVLRETLTWTVTHTFSPSD